MDKIGSVQRVRFVNVSSASPRRAAPVGGTVKPNRSESFDVRRLVPTVRRHCAAELLYFSDSGRAELWGKKIDVASIGVAVLRKCSETGFLAAVFSYSEPFDA